MTLLTLNHQPIPVVSTSESIVVSGVTKAFKTGKNALIYISWYCCQHYPVSKTNPDFVPIHRALPTSKGDVGATIFVHHFSDSTYFHLMLNMTGESIVEAKEAFERLVASHHATVHHYHCDNGPFDAHIFKSSF